MCQRGLQDHPVSAAGDTMMGHQLLFAIDAVTVLAFIVTGGVLLWLARARIKSWVTRMNKPLLCPYRPNPDRNSFIDLWRGCEWKNPPGIIGADPPCVCDGYPSSRQLG